MAISIKLKFVVQFCRLQIQMGGGVYMGYAKRLPLYPNQKECSFKI